MKELRLNIEELEQRIAPDFLGGGFSPVSFQEENCRLVLDGSRDDLLVDFDARGFNPQPDPPGDGTFGDGLLRGIIGGEISR